MAFPSDQELSRFAWAAHKNARIRSGIPVGVALVTTTGAIFQGCNIELEYRLGLHAEVVAIANMLTAVPGGLVTGILIAAERESFAPCGGCLDWILQLGAGADTRVIHESAPGKISMIARAVSLRPFYE